MIYLVQYLDSKGEMASLRIDADSREDARILSKIPERRIQSVREDLVGRLVQLIEPSGPPTKNQAVFMQTLSSSLSTGKTVKQAIASLLDETDWIQAKSEELADCEELADFLRLFRFDKSAILLAETATKTGKYVEALQKSSRYLLDQELAKSQVAAELKAGITYITLGILFFTIVPVIVGSNLSSMRDSGSIMFQPNEVTTLLIHWGAMIENYWYLVPLTLPLALWYRSDIWRLLKHLPFLRIFNYKQVMDRAVRFIGAYSMLHEAGLVDSEAILAIMNSSKGEDKTVLKQMYAELASSQDLGKTFNKQDWPLALRETMGVFGEVEEQEQNKILSALLEALHIEHLHYTRQVAKLLSRLGFILMVSCVIAAVIGFYLPIIAGASSGAAL